MDSILWSVMVGLHRFAPPSDKAELGVLVVGTRERYTWAYFWSQTFSAFSSTCIEKNPTHNFGITIQIKGGKGWRTSIVHVGTRPS